MNSGLTSHQQRGHTETGPRFKVSSERPEKQGIDLATPGLDNITECTIYSYVKLAIESTIDIQLCIGRQSLRLSSYEIDIQL